MQRRISPPFQSLATGLIAASLAANGFAFPVMASPRETAGDLSQYCTAFAAAEPVKGADPTVYVMPSDAKSWFCWGTFATIEQELSYVKPKAGVPMSGDCLYDDAPNRFDLIKLFSKQVRLHPDVRNRMFRDVVFEVVRTAYPCKNGVTGLRLR